MRCAHEYAPVVVKRATKTSVIAVLLMSGPPPKSIEFEKNPVIATLPAASTAMP